MKNNALLKSDSNHSEHYTLNRYQQANAFLFWAPEHEIALGILFFVLNVILLSGSKEPTSLPPYLESMTLK